MNNYPRNNYSGNNYQRNNSQREEMPEKKHEKITETNYVKCAEEAIKEHFAKDDRGRKPKTITTSQLRGLLTNISGIYNDVVHSDKTELDEEMQGRIQYLKVQFLYAAGRESSVKDFVGKAGIIYQIDQIGNDKKQFITFEKYMEALVAYHKYNGGN